MSGERPAEVAAAMMEYDPLLYALVHQGTPGDVGFYLRQCAGAERVLELGCGFGRLLAPLAEAGLRVVGLDRDRGLLSLAANTLAAQDAEVHGRVDLVRGDMRQLPFCGRFDRVLLPHSGLYCLPDDDAVRACLAGIHRLLVPGGRLVLDAYAADGFHHECRPADHAADRLDEVALIAKDGVVYDVFERSTWDRDAQRMVATYVHVPDGGGVALEYSIEQRYLLRPQLEKLLHGAGFRLLQLAGDFAGGSYDEESELIAVVAERPGPN